MTKHCTLKKSCYEDELCHYNKPCENQLLTNADRIRAMTDEELAAERIEFNYNPSGADYYSGDFGHYNIFYNNGVIPPGAYQEAFKKELDWLRQPAEEEV